MYGNTHILELDPGKLHAIHIGLSSIEISCFSKTSPIHLTRHFFSNFKDFHTLTPLRPGTVSGDEND
jgi:hypothetical protein